MPGNLTFDNHREIVCEGANVVIDFTAVWCPPCKTLKPWFAAAEADMAAQLNLTFVKCDVDEQRALAQEYDITGMPTLVFIRGGRELDSARIVGLPTTEKELRAYLNRVFSADDPNYIQDDLVSENDDDLPALEDDENVPYVDELPLPPVEREPSRSPRLPDDFIQVEEVVLNNDS